MQNISNINDGINNQSTSPYFLKDKDYNSNYINLSSYSIPSLSPISSLSSISPLSSLIYDTDNSNVIEVEESIDNTSSTESNTVSINTQRNTSIPLFFPNRNSIIIPKKALLNLTRHTPKNLLDSIDSNREIAVEKCLVVLSNLSSTVYAENRWKKLSSQILHQQTKNGNDNTYVYKSILNALKYGTENKGAMIDVFKNDFGTESYQNGKESKSYRLTDTYFKAGLTEYILKDEDLIAKRNKSFYEQYKLANDNVISANLIELYPRISLPSREEIILEAKKLISHKNPITGQQGYKNKKGKNLTFLNKHSKEYFKDADSRCFVEDSTQLFTFLTSRGFMIPIIGDKKSGGRVVDSFTLMPSWIRELVKIDGERVVECDFKALHPNIAMKIYGGTKKHLNHQQVAQESGVVLQKVKIEHLSFFNKEVRDMKRSELYSYYQSSEQDMIKRLEVDKRRYGHKITSMKMFDIEVQIMTECIRRLNAMGVYVGYVYDALFCKESDSEKVTKIMNDVVVEFGVYTSVSG